MKKNRTPTESFVTKKKELFEYQQKRKRVEAELEEKAEAIRSEEPAPTVCEYLAPDNNNHYRLQWSPSKPSVLELDLRVNMNGGKAFKLQDWYHAGRIDIPFNILKELIKSLQYFVEE
jgi:hypothetical protein